MNMEELGNKVKDLFSRGTQASKQALEKAGDKVQLLGFGTFEQKERAARTARNPQTGEMIEVAASKAVVFKPGKGFKDAVNE